MLILNKTNGLDPISAESFFQFYLSAFSCNIESIRLLKIQKKQSTNNHINISRVRNIGKLLNFIYSRIPKKINFKNDSKKMHIVSLIRELFLFSYLRNRMNQNIGVKFPLNCDAAIIPIITPSAFIIKKSSTSKKILKFNILRENKYSETSRTFIYDWKEISRLEDNLKEFNLSIEKIWLNLREEFIRELLDTTLCSKISYSKEYWWGASPGKFNSFYKTLKLLCNDANASQIISWFGDVSKYSVWDPYQKKILF